MILLVARREVVDHLRSPRFLALCALTVVLLPLSAYVNAGDWQARRAYHDALRHAQLARLTAADSTGDVIAADGVRGRAPWGWRAGEVSTDDARRASRAPAPLSVLAAGDDASLPAYWQFGSEGVAKSELSKGRELGRVVGRRLADTHYWDRLPNRLTYLSIRTSRVRTIQWSSK